MTKEYVYLLCWDEIGGEAQTQNLDEQGEELTIPITCSDEELVAFVRAQTGDEEDPDMPWGEDWRGEQNTWGWRCTAVSRSKNTATIEWRSDRNHLAVTTIIWFEG